MASSEFVVPSRFAPSGLTRGDPSQVDWSKLKTFNDGARVVDALMAPAARGAGPAAYDYDALDSGGAETAAVELARRGIKVDRVVVPALPENPTSEQRRRHEWDRERAAYAAGRLVHGLRVLDAAQQALGVDPPSSGKVKRALDAVAQRQQAIQTARLPQQPTPDPMPVSDFDIDDDDVPGWALFWPIGAEANDSGAVTSYAAPSGPAGILDGIGQVLVMLGVYAAAFALLGPIGVGLAMKARREAVKADLEEAANGR